MGCICASEKDSEAIGTIMQIHIPYMLLYCSILRDSSLQLLTLNESSYVASRDITQKRRDGVVGEEFEALFEKYEKEGRARKTVKAQKLWYAVLEAQIETGGPFMLYKDSANSRSLFSHVINVS